MGERTVIITGAGGNLGAACVTKFSEEGFNVIGTLSPGKSVTSQNPHISYRPVDLTNEKECANFIDKTGREAGTIDAALLTAGGYAFGGIRDASDESLHKMLSINFFTAYLMARPIFLQMIKQPEGGRLIFVGSRTALLPKAGKSSLAYSLSKSLVFKLAELLNAEGADHNVVSHVIVPSTIDTPENREAMPKANFSDWVKPEEIAEAMYFLCSEEGKSLREMVFKVYGNA